MKCRLVGSFLSEFFLMRKLYKPCLKDAVCQDIRVFGLPFHEKKIFKNSPNFTPFCPLLGPNRRQLLDFRKLESTYPKNASCQIWFKSVQWFWRRSRLKQKFTDGRGMTTRHYSSLEPSDQVN